MSNLSRKTGLVEMESHPELVLLTAFQSDAIHLDHSYSSLIPVRYRLLFPLLLVKKLRPGGRKLKPRFSCPCLRCCSL